MAPFFTFQQSNVWDAHNAIDPEGEKKVVKAKDESRARRKLPASNSRSWILIDSKEN